jgi:hypothetical protein
MDAHLCGTNDLSSSTLALSCTFNDTWQIENLNFGSTIFEDSWDGRQGGERICCYLGFGLGDLGQEGRLAH